MAAETFRAEYNYGGVNCGHHHRTYEAAERCGRHIVRLARSGHQFDGAHLWRTVEPTAETVVAIYRDGLRVGG